jgi:hypothetical protein
MTYRNVVGQLVLAGAVMTAGVIALPPLIADAQAITCAPGTTVLQRAVGSPNAPMLVPAQVHATICSQNGTVIAIVPSFTTVGPSSAPLIIPVNTGVTTCVPATVATVPVVGGGPTPPLQVVQVGANVTTVTSIGTVVTTPMVLTCH